MSMANRDKDHKSRIEWQKANGTYKSDKNDLNNLQNFKKDGKK